MSATNSMEELAFASPTEGSDLDPRRMPFAKSVAAVLRPARVVLDGGVVPGGALEAIDQAANRIAATLSTVTGVGVAIERCELAAVSDTDVALAVDLECEGGRLHLRIDLSGARAIVDAVSAGWTGLCGEGPLTETEAGLLEYVTLRTLDLFERGRGLRGGTVRVVALRTRRELGAWEGDRSLRIRAALTVGGRRGRLELCFLDDPSQFALWRHAPATHRSTSSDTVDVFVELPPVLIGEDELANCKSGDLLLLGMRHLDASPSPSLLVTTTGWRVSAVRVIDATATVVRVRLSSLEVAPADESMFAGDDVVLRPRLGIARSTLADLRRLTEGSTFDLSLRSGAVVDLAYGGSVVGSGELVSHSGELALRLVALDTVQLGES